MITLPQCLPAAMAVLLAACASSQISTREIRQSEAGALALVASSQEAHGKKAFAKLRDVTVRYEGRWSAVAPRVQPILSDAKFRGSSRESLHVESRTLVQEHRGPMGRKHVVRRPGEVTVAYNEILTTDPETLRAATLVADAYTLFLLGPFYFDRPGVVLASVGESEVDGAVCDKVLAVLRPGFGEAEEDRVILFIDRASKRLLRVRMTLNGLESTRGAEVDVTFRDFRAMGGIVWPTDFDERIRRPFDLPAHHWRLIGLEMNRGFRGP